MVIYGYLSENGFERIKNTPCTSKLNEDFYKKLHQMIFKKRKNEI